MSGSSCLTDSLGDIPVIRLESTANVSLDRVAMIPVHVARMLTKYDEPEGFREVSVYANFGADSTQYKMTYLLLSGRTVGYKFEERSNELTLVEKI